MNNADAPETEQVRLRFLAETKQLPAGKGIVIVFPMELEDIAEKAVRMVASRYRTQGRLEDLERARIARVV
jgi:hypothetical protein